MRPLEVYLSVRVRALMDDGGGPTPRPRRSRIQALPSSPARAAREMLHVRRPRRVQMVAPEKDAGVGAATAVLGGVAARRGVWGCVCVMRVVRVACVDVVAPYEADAPLSGDASEGDLAKARRACGRVLNEDGRSLCREAVIFHLDGRGRRRRSGGCWC